MKKILFGLLALIVFSCTKENPDPESDLVFQSITIVSDIVSSGDITATATVVGPNLCYKFTHFEISNSRQNQNDIYAKGTIPKPEDVCAQALYQKDTTVTINKPVPGTYRLNFWNPKNQLFKSETVTVN